MTKISVVGNRAKVAILDPMNFGYRLIATTCPTSLRLGSDFNENPFKFFPTNQDHLVLMEKALMSFGTWSYKNYVLFHLKTNKQGFLNVEEDPSDPEDSVAPELNYQLLKNSIEITTNGVRFTSDTKAVAGVGEKVMVVDEASILRFIVGEIKIKDLREAGKKVAEQLDIKAQLKIAKKAQEEAERAADIANQARRLIEDRMNRIGKQLVPN